MNFVNPDEDREAWWAALGATQKANSKQRNDKYTHKLGESPGLDLLKLAETSLTQLGNAELFKRIKGNDVRYIHDEKKWWLWNGEKWAETKKGEIQGAMTDALAYWYRIGDAVESAAKQSGKKDGEAESEREIFRRWGKSCESAANITASLSLAHNLEGIATTSDEFDTDHYLLNIETGVVDLKSGSLLPHKREHYMSLLAPVLYDVNARCPNWESFIAYALRGDKALIRYFKQMCGLILTGEDKEQLIFILVGEPESGKSTALKVLRKMLGDYAKRTDMTTFVAGKFSNPNAPRGDLTRLRKARLVTASEAEEGQQFAVALLKQLAGGDGLTARGLYQEQEESEFIGKIVLSTNDLPLIPAHEEAIWRRIRAIRFSKDENYIRDNDLDEKLYAEIPGILNWCLEGCRDWLENGMVTPKAVEEENVLYREAVDSIGLFLNECCQINATAKISFSDLYRFYEVWCEDEGDKPESKKTVSTYITSRHKECQSERGTRGRKMFKGIGMKYEALQAFRSQGVGISYRAEWADI